jgi:hypothetical protein
MVLTDDQGNANYKGGWNIPKYRRRGDEINLKNLASRLRINDHIIFHGFVHGKELDRLFEQNHIAVGSLGIHRIGLNQLSILKAREYCARGIPFGGLSLYSETWRMTAIDIEPVILFSSKIVTISSFSK